MYNCFKLGFYSRLGIPDNQEVPGLEPLIKAAYDQVVSTKAPVVPELKPASPATQNIVNIHTPSHLASKDQATSNKELADFINTGLPSDRYPVGVMNTQALGTQYAVPGVQSDIYNGLHRLEMPSGGAMIYSQLHGALGNPNSKSTAFFRNP